MQKHQDKEFASSLFPSYVVKNEETISTCSVKQENVPTEEICHLASSSGKRPLIDSRHEMNTHHRKRIKQEGNESSFWKDRESILLSSKTSLQNIINELAHSFENNADIYGSIPTSQRSKTSRLDGVNRALSTEEDPLVFQHGNREPKRSHQIAVDVNEFASERENHKASMLSGDKGKREISVLSIADQLQDETTKPILRTIRSSDSGKSEGFAYDHNFFPKLVGVHSISKPLSSSTETDFQRTNYSLPVLEEPHQHQNINGYAKTEEAADAYEVKPCASSQTLQIPRDSRSQSPSNIQSEKEYDLLFTFKQDDDKNDMFLVIKDKVFSVERFNHKGESYLVHTDNKGKNSILARAPKEGRSGSHDSGRKIKAIGQRVSNNRTQSTNVSTVVSELSRQTFLQRTTSHQPAPLPSSSATIQNSSSRMVDINARQTANATSGQHQLVDDDTQMLRRLLSNAGERAQSFGSRPLLAAGQERVLFHAGGAGRHQVITNDSLQNSNAVTISTHTQAPTVPNTSSNILHNQQFITSQNLADRMNKPTHNATNDFSQQPRTNTVQGLYSGYNTFAGLSSRNASETNENRTEQRKEFMRYINLQLASSGKRTPAAGNSSELINLVTKGREVERQNYSENVTKGTGSSSTYQEMLEPRPHSGASLSPRRAEGHNTSRRSVCSGLGTNIGDFDAGKRYHPCQRVCAYENSGDMHSQLRSNAPHLNVNNHLQRGLQSKGESEGSKKVLEIIESWKRRQQPFSSSNTFRQLKELLTRVDGSVDSSQDNYFSTGEETLNKHSQVMHPSTVASATPVISQVSYGVINRLTDGENVTPKRTATAVLVDQRHSIYVDASDSVIDERTLGNTGQQFSNTRNTVSGLSCQSGNVVTSSGSRVAGRLQETKSVTSGQQPNFSSKLLQNLAAFSDKRLYNLEMPPRKTAPKVDKRCVANNTLSPVKSPIIPATHERSFATSFVSGQQSCFNEAPVQSNPKIASPSEVTMKPCKVPSYGLGDVTGLSEAAKLDQLVKPCEAATAIDKTGTVDVVEIIDSPPARDSLPSPIKDSENHEKDSYKIVSGQLNCINEAPSNGTALYAIPCHVDENATDGVVEITNSPLKGHSTDHVTENRNNLNLQPEEDEQTRINALRAELLKKIQNTNERIAEENIDWKKKYLNRLKVVLTKKLAKLPGGIDVTVIDDD